MKCKHCPRIVDESELWADEFCQDCWELYCSRTWHIAFGEGRNPFELTTKEVMELK